MLLRDPHNRGYPTHDGPTQDKIHGKNGGATFAATAYRDDGWKKVNA
jgi:hypothetical protein